MKSDTGLKFVSVVLALVLWAYVRVSVGGVTQKVMSQLDLRVPLEIRGEGSNLIPYEKSASAVTVTLRGESSIVSDLREGLVRASIDVRDMVSGSHWPEVQVLVPQGVQILSVEPKSVNVKLSSPMVREVALLIEGTGEPKAGYRALKPIFSPKVVSLRGPEALVSKVDKVISLVPIGGASKTFSLTIRDLTPVNSSGNTVLGIDSSIRIVPPQIDATIPIEKVQSVVTLPVLLDRVEAASNSEYHYEIEAVPSSVKVHVLPTYKGSLPKGIFTESVYFKASAGALEQEVNLEQIDGISIMGDTKIRVRLIPKKIVSTISRTST